MKIKTIWDTDPNRFDGMVNLWLEKGWSPGRREVIPDTRDLDNSVFYMELVWMDPAPEVPEPQPLDPFEALQQLQEFCDSNQCEGCRLHDFCARHLANNEGPSDWILPGEEAPEA